MTDTNCLHINCGGGDATIKENKQIFVYKGDGDVEGGTAKYFRSPGNFWGFSSTGDFMDDNDSLNAHFTESLPSSDVTVLNTTARTSPLSLTYFHYCLENGKYKIKLYFDEIQFTSDNTYNSLGRRMFDIYVQVVIHWINSSTYKCCEVYSDWTTLLQGKLVLKDFNIVEEAGRAQKPIVKQVPNVGVTNNVLEVRFQWAGKGTTRIPNRGVYGPLISAIAVESGESLNIINS